MGFDTINVKGYNETELEEVVETGIKFFGSTKEEISSTESIAVRMFGTWMSVTVIKDGIKRRICVTLDLDSFIFEGYLFYYKGTYWEVYLID